MENEEVFLPTLPSLLTRLGEPFIQRDLSWLLFNDRVLAEARTSSNPLLERVKFLAITATNLDEFFMIRLASLTRSTTAAAKGDPERLARLLRIRDAILERVAHFGAKQTETLDILTNELEAIGVRIVRNAKPGDPAYEIGKKVFEEKVFPHLPPPEGFSQAKWSTVENLKMGVFYPNEIWFRVSRKIPPVYWEKGEGENEMYFFLLDDLISMYLGPAHRLVGTPGFLRLTRDGDIEVDFHEEDPADIPEIVRLGLGSREMGRPVRLQYQGELPEGLLSDTIRQLKLSSGQVFPSSSTLCLQGLWGVFNNAPLSLADKPNARYPIAKPVLHKRIREGAGFFAEIQKKDILLHHPYDSFDAYVEFIRAASEDNKVSEIQQTIYRMDAGSPVIELLKKAAKRKRVRALIELRARFDELNNLRLAEELRAAGVEVAYGFGSLKLHAKVAVVTRHEEGQERYYTHLSTGNYNSTTAKLYEDMALLTANQDMGDDAHHFFDSVAAGEVPSNFRALVAAPTDLHRKLCTLIQAEIAAAKKGHPARIVAKVNALVDEIIVKQLYKASQAGVQVDLIVRGACTLIPGVKGLSENIRVVSIVDRYLEHSRIYYFGHAKALYLSSADWMPRNFFSRLELAFPILDPVLYQFIEQVVIPAYLADSVRARELTPQGLWKKRTHAAVRSLHKLKDYPILGSKALRSQFFFEGLSTKDYQGSTLE